jgi:hypothetical protein
MYSLEQDIAQLVRNDFKPRKKRIWPYVTALLIGLPIAIAAVTPSATPTPVTAADIEASAARRQCVEYHWTWQRAADLAYGTNDASIGAAESYCQRHPELSAPR